MKYQKTSERRPKNGRSIAAVVLGTALATLGSSSTVSAGPAGGNGSSVNDISRYCTACWRNAGLTPDCWNDCTQEVFCRLLERVPTKSWGQLLATDTEERREFIRAIDTVKKRGQRARKWASDFGNGLPDQRAARQQVIRQDRAAVVEVAGRLLTPRQQRILQLCFDGCTIAQVGSELDLSAERVSDEKYKAVRKLQAYFRIGLNAVDQPASLS